MPNSTKPKPAPLALLSAAVAAFAAAFSLARVSVRKAGHLYHVEYAWFEGAPLVHTTATRNPKTALHRFEKAVQDDYATIH